MVDQGRKKDLDRPVLTPRHSLSNCYTARAGDNPVHPPAAVSRPDLDSSTKKAPANTMGSPQQMSGDARVAHRWAQMDDYLPGH